MKDLQKKLESDYRDFKISRNRDGDATLTKSTDLGKIWIDIIFNDQTYQVFKVVGFLRFEVIEQMLSPFIYNLNPAYKKNSSSISIDSYRTTEFNDWQEAEYSRIKMVVDFILSKLYEVQSYENLAHIIDDPSFRYRKLVYSYIPVSAEMRRIAIGVVLQENGIENLIKRQLEYVDQFKSTGAFQYKSLTDFIQSLDLP